jgi:uncharacterized repeat protein (TIGR01451 family)/uncharacterized delta-60 repeat protein
MERPLERKGCKTRRREMLRVINYVRSHESRIARRFFAFTIATAVALAALLSPASLSRVRADVGGLDLSFGQGGEVFLSPFSGTGARVAIQPDGKIVVAHREHLGQVRLVLVDRYLPSGELEWSHLVPGTIHPITAGVKFNLKVLIRPDGKILVANTNETSIVVQFLSNGSVDTRFGSGGQLSPDFFSGEGEKHPSPGYLEDVDVLPDNRLLILGRTNLGRANLQLFDAGGAYVQRVFPPLGGDNLRLAVEPDGRFVVSATVDSVVGSFLVRYNADLTGANSLCGSIPCAFGFGEIAVAKDSKIVIGHKGFAWVSRRMPNGDSDAGFGISGLFQIGVLGSVSALKVDDTGRILVGLSEFLPNSNGLLWTIDANGSTAEALDQLGDWRTRISDIALQENGKVVVSGYVSDGTMLRRYHHSDRRTTAANLGFDHPVTVIKRGDEIEYTIRVVNDGPDKAGHVTFENPLPDGTTFVSFEAPAGWVSYQLPRLSGGKVSCSAYRLENGESATFRLTVRLKSNVAFGTPIQSISRVNSLVHDPDSAGNQTTTTLIIVD